MKIEHFAINVAEPLVMADWYVENFGMSIVKSSKSAPFMTFLADDSKRVMIEIYTNPADKVPDYTSMDPLILHIAFVSDDPAADASRLVKAGAILISEDHLPDGSHLAMLRDPWGIAIQLCKRGVPMLSHKDMSDV